MCACCVLACVSVGLRLLGSFAAVWVARGRASGRASGSRMSKERPRRPSYTFPGCRPPVFAFALCAWCLVNVSRTTPSRSFTTSLLFFCVLCLHTHPFDVPIPYIPFQYLFALLSPPLIPPVPLCCWGCNVCVGAVLATILDLFFGVTLSYFLPLPAGYAMLLTSCRSSSGTLRRHDGGLAYMFQCSARSAAHAALIWPRDALLPVRTCQTLWSLFTFLPYVCAHAVDSSCIVLASALAATHMVP